MTICAQQGCGAARHWPYRPYDANGNHEWMARPPRFRWWRLAVFSTEYNGMSGHPASARLPIGHMRPAQAIITSRHSLATQLEAAFGLSRCGAGDLAADRCTASPRHLEDVAHATGKAAFEHVADVPARLRPIAEGEC